MGFRDMVRGVLQYYAKIISFVPDIESTIRPKVSYLNMTFHFLLFTATREATLADLQNFYETVMPPKHPSFEEHDPDN